MSLPEELKWGHRSYRASQPRAYEPTEIRAGYQEAKTASSATEHLAKMRVSVLREIPEDLKLAGDWNRLVEQMEHREVFFTYEWALAVARAFRASRNPLLFLMHKGDELTGVAALATYKGSRANASFLAAGTADYCDIVSTPQARGEVLACLLGELRKLGLRHLSFAVLPSDSLTWRDLAVASRAQHFHLAWRPDAECGIVGFGSEEQRASMLDTVTRKSREQRALKKLTKRGPVQISHLVKPAETSGCLPQIVSAQVSRFLATGRISPLVRSERRVFLQELTALLSAQGWLKISRLEVNHQPIAWNFGFRFGDSWFWYLPTFRMDDEDSSPGSCLLRLLVEEGCADPSLQELDLGLGDESYKSRFATAVRSSCHVELSGTLSRHFLVTAWNLAKTGAARFPRSVARLKPARKLARSLAHRLRSEGLAATIERARAQIARLGPSQDEILFFEATAKSEIRSSNVYLGPTTWENLAQAAIANADDAATLQYLLSAAARRKEGKASGFVLCGPEEQAVHFSCVAPVDGFHIEEIGHTISGFDSRNLMIFNCWTPARFRGRGYHSLAIRWVAAELRNHERTAWTFCSAEDSLSIREILQAGFTYRYSLVRKRRLGQSAIVRQDRTNALPLENSGLRKRPDLAVRTSTGT